MTVSTELPVATSAFCLPRHRRRAGSSRSPTSMPSPALNRVAAPEALDDEVEALVARIVAKPRVAALGKALFYRQLEQGLVVAHNRHDEVVGVSLHTSGKQPEHAAVRTRWSGRRAAVPSPEVSLT